MTDKELLELAAKAAGIEGEWERDTAFMQERWYFNVPYDNHNMLSGFEWNPLREDGDALRLAVKLEMDINAYRSMKETSACQFKDGIVHRCIEKTGGDPYAATRRAIVRAAAEIGKEMK